MLKRRLKLLGKILLALIMLLVVFLLFERFRGQIALASYKKELLAKGEKLSPQDFVTTFAEADNGALVAIAAIERLERGMVLPHSYPPRMKIVPSGRAVVCFRESEWVETGTYRNEEWVNEKATNRWDRVAADLKANEVNLDEVITALAKPILNNQLDLSQGANMKFLHLSPAKAITQWLGAGIQLALHEGRNRDALDYLLVQIRLPRLLAEDRIVISEWVRIATSGIAKVDTWEALQAEGWTDEDLAAMQSAWKDQVFASAMARSLEGERVLGDVSYDAMRGSNQEAYDLLFWEELYAEGFNMTTHEWNVPELTFSDGITHFLKQQVYCRIWRFAWSHQTQRHNLATMQRLIDIARSAARDKSFIPTEEAVTSLILECSGGGIYDRLRHPYCTVATISKTVAKALRAETQRSLVLSAIALKRYSLRHGKLPAKLDDLVPEFLQSVPVDYMDGKPIKYRPNDDGGFILYSVGEDGKDDGGDSSLLADKPNARQLWARKDFLWPTPALPEEIAASRKESAEQ